MNNSLIEVENKLKTMSDQELKNIWWFSDMMDSEVLDKFLEEIDRRGLDFSSDLV